MNDHQRELLTTYFLDPQALAAGETREARNLSARFPEFWIELRAVVSTLYCEDPAPVAELTARLLEIPARLEHPPMNDHPDIPSPKIASADPLASPRPKTSRRRWFRSGAVAAAAIVGGGAVIRGLWRPSHVTRAGTPIQPASTKLPRTLADARAAASQLRQLEVDASRVDYTGSYSTGYSNAQLAVEKKVYAAGLVDQKVKVKDRDGKVKEFDLPAPDTTKIEEDPLVKGYALSQVGFDILTYQRSYHAQLCKQILFTTQDAHIYPGALLQGTDWITKRLIVPIGLDPGSRSPLGLTLFGVSKRDGLPGASDLRASARKNQAVNVPDLASKADRKELADSYLVETPDSREAYERALRDLIPRVQQVDNWSATVETVHSIQHLDFMLKGSAGLTWGPVAASMQASIGNEEDEEKARVFMLLTRAAYTVAVDGAPLPAAWFSPQVNPDRVNFVGPPVYVASVTYGQVILIIAQSNGKSSALKEALKASFSYAGLIRGDGEAEKNARLTLSSASVNAFVFGGHGAPLFEADHSVIRPPTTEHAEGMNGVCSMLGRLLKAELTPPDALPIAFETKYLTSHQPAGFVGWLPLKTYSSTPEPYRCEVFLVEANINDDFDGFLAGDGEFHMMVSLGDDNSPLILPRQEYEERTYTYNPPLQFVGGTGIVTSRTFTLKFRVGDEDGRSPGGTWRGMENLDEWSERTASIRIEDLLAEAGYQKDYRLGGNGGNSYLLRVKLLPPSQGDPIEKKDTSLKNTQ